MEITMQNEFANATNPTVLLDRLKKHKENGIKVVHTYGFRSIKIDCLINKIDSLINDGFDLGEIYRQIHYEMN